MWGKNDPFFTGAGAHAYERDVPKAEVHILESGHFTLEEHSGVIAGLIKEFLESRVVARTRRPAAILSSKSRRSPRAEPVPSTRSGR